MNVQSQVSCRREDAIFFITEIAKDTGLLAEERAGETFRFIHLTFCEFLAALEAVEGQEEGWSQLIEAQARFQASPEPAQRSRLVEVIPFACGLLPRHKRGAAIEDVENIGLSNLLALAFLEVTIYVYDPPF